MLTKWKIIEELSLILEKIIAKNFLENLQFAYGYTSTVEVIKEKEVEKERDGEIIIVKEVEITHEDNVAPNVFLANKLFEEFNKLITSKIEEGWQIKTKR